MDLNVDKSRGMTGTAAPELRFDRLTVVGSGATIASTAGCSLSGPAISGSGDSDTFRVLWLAGPGQFSRCFSGGLLPLDNHVTALEALLLFYHAFDQGTAAWGAVGISPPRSSLFVRSHDDLAARAKPTLRSNIELRQERLMRVKSAFGLTTAQLAGVCGVSRMQVYNWLDREHLHLNPANWKRLADLTVLADHWNAVSAAPASELLHEAVGGHTLITLLQEHELDFVGIRELMRHLAQVSRAPRRDEKLRAAGFRPRPLIGQLASDE